MTTFTIDTTNKIAAYTAAADALAGEGIDTFATEEELARLAFVWHVRRLAETWNQLPGVTAVKKFTDRASAVTRIWKAIQTLEVQEAAPTKPAIKSRKRAMPTQADGSAQLPPKTDTKKAQVLALIGKPEGATLEELMAATGWQSHSLRGFMSGALVKNGIKVESFKNADGQRTYRLSA